MRIIHAHPGVGHFVQQTSRALYEAGWLKYFLTTFVSNTDSLLQKTACYFTKVIGYDLRTELERRAIKEIPMSFVKQNPLREIARTVVSKFDSDGRISDLIFDWSNKSFDNWVSSTILNETDCVYGYEYACHETFNKAKDKGLLKIYEVPSPEHDFVEDLIREEIQKFPEIQKPYFVYTELKRDERTFRRRNEWELADIIIVNSEFTKRTYQNAGLNVSKVHVVPLGAPEISKNSIFGGSSETEPCKFLWAGTFSIRKGAHYMLEAWIKTNPINAELNIFGAIELPKNLIKTAPTSIKFSPTVTRRELNKNYLNSDVLVIPTLCDGFGMVIMEAFSQGLPVITTDRAGASHFVRHGLNGFIAKAGDSDALSEIIVWCLNNRNKLKVMRKAALETAEKWQWSDYRRDLIENLLDGIHAAGYKL